MIQNEIRLARRKIWLKKRSSFTKLFSLILGIVSVFYIALYVYQEFSFDGFHKREDSIVKLNTTIESPTGELALGLTAIPVGPFLQSESPLVKDFVRISKEQGSHSVKHGEHLFSESENIYYSDPSIFSLFDFELLFGNPNVMLDGPDKIVLTERSALKYFGTTNALDKVLLYDGAPLTVTGIVQNNPSNSHLQFDFLISMDTFLKDRTEASQNWEWFPMNTYLLLEDQANNMQLGRFLSEIPSYQELSGSGDQYILSMEPLAGLHFSSTKLGELGTKGKLSNLYVLLGVGLMTLLLAVFNFINLTTAQVSNQEKDVAVQKTLGASKKDLFRQFFVESILLTTIATVLSLGVIALTFNAFEHFMGTNYNIAFLLDLKLLTLLPFIPVILSLLGGVYPAMVFTRISANFKSKLTGTPFRLINTRTSLLIFQFSITSILVVCSLITYYQLNFLENKDLGMSTTQKLVLEYGPNSEIGTSYDALKQVFGQIPGVKSVTFSSHVPGQVPNGVATNIMDVKGKFSHGEINLNLVDHDFIQDYGLQIIAGRNFRKGASDNTSALILNEAAVKAFGYSDPQDILGASFEQWGGDGQVVGVVKDFNYLSLHENIGLLSLKVWPEQFTKITFQIEETAFQETLETLNRKWLAMYPNIPFNHYFVDDQFKAQYRKDQLFSSIINIFTLISMGIGILGLIAYANFWCERRKKEMTIRKVLGAGVTRLVWKLYQGFSLPVLIGFLLAIPVSFYLGNQWLQGFAYRFELDWQFFVWPLLFLLLLVWMAVGMQTINLALSNPTNNLKEE